MPEWLAGLCFDTTSSNTGIHTFAITVIQRAFQKRLLFLPCRHHILELLSTAVFDLFFASSGPQIALFSRFKDYWRKIDVKNFTSIDADTTVPGNRCASTSCIMTDAERQWLREIKGEVVTFLKQQLTGKTATPRLFGAHQVVTDHAGQAGTGSSWRSSSFQPSWYIP